MSEPDFSAIPEAVAQPKKGHRIQLVWLIPIIAAIIGGSLAVKSYLQKGPTITITFKSGEGLEAGKTKIKFRDVEIGTVTDVSIAKDLAKVVVTAELKKRVTPHLVEDTKFWVVKPRISGGTVSGLGTIMGGSYIGIEIGKSQKPLRAFTGLETPPVISMDVPGTKFLLHGKNLGSLDIGSPIYFRHIQVGQIVNYSLNQNGSGIDFVVFVNAPYDKYVRANSRFWNVSGIDLNLDANGLKVHTQSIVTILLGGIAFETFDDAGPPPSPTTAFILYPTWDEAIKQQDAVSQGYVMVFKESVRGLSVGAPVDFRGITIGEVTGIRLEFDQRSRQINMMVESRVYPDRLRSKARGAIPGSIDEPHVLIDEMVKYGLRAQLKSGNLLTGQLFISVDFFPDAAKTQIDWKVNPPQFPTTPSSLVEIQTSVSQIMHKLGKLPVEEIAGELRQTVKTLDATLKSAETMIKNVDTTIVPETKDAMSEAKQAMSEARKALAETKQALASDSPLQLDLREALKELARAAQSIRVLTDYLDRHPESLIQGKQEDKKP